MSNIPEKVRKTVYDRAEGMCEAIIDRFVPGIGNTQTRCYSRNGLSMHHKKFRSRGGKNTPENLILVCMHCHNTIQFGTKERWAEKYRVSRYKKHE